MRFCIYNPGSGALSNGDTFVYNPRYLSIWSHHNWSVFGWIYSYSMNIGLTLCFFTFSNALPMWGKFGGHQAKTTLDNCTFLYKVTTSNLPAQIRRNAFRMIAKNKCYSQKVSQHRNVKHKTFRFHHQLP